MHGLDHRRGAAQKDLDILGSSRAVFTDHISRDKTHATGPASRSLVEHIVHVEVAVLRGELIQFLLEQNILLLDIGKNEVDNGLVVGVLANSTDNL